MTIGRKFGQHEPLTTRLNNLVRSYPKGLGILKEFIQNADDTEADEIVFVIDEKQHDVSGLPESMRWMHTCPALLVRNNRPFSERDIEGIQNVELGRPSRIRASFYDRRILPVVGLSSRVPPIVPAPDRPTTGI